MNLTTESLILRSPDEVSADAVSRHHLANRTFMSSFDPVWPDSFYTAEGQAALLKKQIQEWESGCAYRLYLSPKAEPERVIGTVSLTGIIRGPFLSCFIGVSLEETCTRRGYMTEAVRRTVRFAFDDLGLHRIEANIMPRNLPSRGLAEKCGFICEGLSRKYLKISGIWEDHLHYVLLNEEMD